MSAARTISSLTLRKPGGQSVCWQSGTRWDDEAPATPRACRPCSPDVLPQIPGWRWCSPGRAAPDLRRRPATGCRYLEDRTCSGVWWEEIAPGVSNLDERGKVMGVRRIEIPIGLAQETCLPVAVRGTYLVLASLCGQGENRCVVRRRDLVKALGLRSVTTVR